MQLLVRYGVTLFGNKLIISHLNKILQVTYLCLKPHPSPPQPLKILYTPQKRFLHHFQHLEFVGYHYMHNMLCDGEQIGAWK